MLPQRWYPRTRSARGRKHVLHSGPDFRFCHVLVWSEAGLEANERKAKDDWRMNRRLEEQRIKSGYFHFRLIGFREGNKLSGD